MYCTVQYPWMLHCRREARCWPTLLRSEEKMVGTLHAHYQYFSVVRPIEIRWAGR